MRRQKAEAPGKPALDCALDCLGRQDCSESRLREKLLRKGYGEEEIAGALGRLKELRYLDDGAACARQFRFLYEESRSSVRQICAKLLQRGFPPDLVRSCIPPDTLEREQAAAAKCLRIKFRRPAEARRMMQYLYAKGFGCDAIRGAVEAAGADDLPDLE